MEIDQYKSLINPFIRNRYERKVTGGKYPFDFKSYNKSFELPEIDYMAYLRHHGFPTPFIDFSSSPFVALFFACEDFNQDQKANGKVFVLNKQHTKPEEGMRVPALLQTGRYIEAGKRHVAQQSEYVIPVVFDKCEWKFVAFDKVFEKGNPPDDSGLKYDDYFKEIIIASDSKKEIMKELKKMGITRYTMYLNEDALIQSIADDWILEEEPPNPLRSYLKAR